MGKYPSWMPVVHLFADRLLATTRKETDMGGEKEDFTKLYDAACKIGYLLGELGI